ncbi:hypothetical protein [Candidatus Pristimantibacillus sp. PTI5]|uniref:hypothetical protein n=1 Tax=Candidatus Pristimantibacillus sp. PTI5 TaxID=3400422 RepID=UPI003B02B88E
MNAADFNRLYEDIVIKRLQEQGYATKGQSLFLQREATVAALLRSSFRGEQGTDLVFCIRHAFVREYLTLTNKSYLMNAIDYPFRFTISSYKQEDLFTKKAYDCISRNNKNAWIEKFGWKITVTI